MGEPHPADAVRLAVSSFAFLACVGLVSARAATSASYDWTGPYLGAHLGGAWDSRRFSQTTTAGPLVESGSINSSSAIGGGQVGYNWTPARSILVGVEADVSGAGLTGRTRTFNLLGVGPGWKQDVDAAGTARIRAGWTPGQWLLYGSGGLAWADDQFSRTQLTGNPGTPPVGLVVSNNAVRVGWAAGAGIERALASRWSIKLEYQHMQFGGASSSFTTMPGIFTFSERPLSLDLVQLGLNYRFR